jgi:hypothetical protein
MGQRLLGKAGISNLLGTDIWTLLLCVFSYKNDYVK